MMRVPSVLFWFCVEMTVCTVMGVLLFQYHITPELLACYAVTSLLFATVMSMVQGKAVTT